MNAKRLFICFQVLAGGCDTVTGLILVFAPAFALRSMGIRHVVSEPIFISFIGAFVFAVGLSYLLFATPPRDSGQICEVKTAWLITAIVRLCAGAFVAAACLGGQLEPAWLGITFVDLSLAVFQLGARGRLTAMLA